MFVAQSHWCPNSIDSQRICGQCLPLATNIMSEQQTRYRYVPSDGYGSCIAIQILIYIFAIKTCITDEFDQYCMAVDLLFHTLWNTLSWYVEKTSFPLHQLSISIFTYLDLYFYTTGGTIQTVTLSQIMHGF